MGGARLGLRIGRALGLLRTALAVMFEHGRESESIRRNFGGRCRWGNGMATEKGAKGTGERPAGTLAAEELCSITGLTDRRHRQIAAAGYFPAPTRGWYEAGKTLAGIIRWQRELLAKRNDELRQEQHAHVKAKRQIAEEELALLRDEYVAKKDIAPALRNISLHQRAVLKAKLEQELAPKLVNRTTLEILHLVQVAVDEVCAIFREGTKQWATEPPKTT